MRTFISTIAATIITLAAIVLMVGVSGPAIAGV